MAGKSSTAVVALALLVLAVPTPASAADEETLEYVGFGSVDHGLNGLWQPFCHVLVPRGCDAIPGDELVVWDCSSPRPPVQWGGVLFCDVPLGSKVHLEIEDDTVEDPLATVVCLSEHPNNGEEYRPLAQIRGKGTVAVASWCKSTPGSGNSTTALGVIIEGPPDEIATHGHVHRAFV